MDNTQRTVVVAIEGDASGLTASTQQANQSLSALGNNPATASLKNQLRAATLEAQRLLLANQENTQEYRDQTAEIARLRDAQDVFNRTIPDAGNALAGVSRAAQIVSGSIAALSPVFKSVFPDAGGLIDGLVASLGGISAAIGVIDTVGDVGDVLTPYIEGLRAAAVAQNALNVSAGAGAAIQRTSTVALLANAAATNVANAATKAWNFVLSLNPIGLIVTALALVAVGIVTFKDKLMNIIPGLRDFIKLGTATVQFLTDLVGITSEASREADKYSEAVARQNKQLEYQNKILSAKGENERQIYLNSRKILTNTISDLKVKAKAEDEYNQEYYDKLNEAIQERNILDVKEQKRINDSAKKKADEAKKVADEEAKKLADKNKAAADKQKAIDTAKNEAIKKSLADAKKFTAEAYLSERQLSEKAIDDLYDSNIKVTKAKYGEFSKETLALVEAKNIAMGEVDTKYNQIYEDKVAEIRNKGLNEFDKRVLEIYKTFDALIKADPTNKDNLIQLQTEEVKTVRKEETTNKIVNNIDEGLSDVNLSPADKEALENLKLQEQYDNGLINKQAFENAKNKIESEASKARQEIDDAEKATKEKNLDAIANLTANAASLLGEATVAGKVLAISSASISTYLSAQKAYESMVGIPFVGPTLAPIAAGVAVATGLASIKKIISVKVPSTAGSGSGGFSAPSFTANSAPVINSTQLQDRGVQDVRNVNENTTTKQEPIRAFIVNDDLDSKAAKDKFIDSFSRTS
ncbi:hypothetical protein [Pedobacter sp. MR2016-24]|uniref:hypothetical protein n=1 Tax=Pedobacter sp. MR2016-24 TaxID=2994466 RepID=UPI0022464934|nr:hypothetical protein [Pedobacter sp. MR2016-24]MCX2486602.1 hypothetical protein [Pedobacter sp. MR2016-24]